MKKLENYEKEIFNSFEKLKTLDENVVNLSKQNKWSKKEILGHLCDSAVNNIYRFMRLQKSGQVFEIDKYDQNLWVDQASYRERSWSELIQYWYSLNFTILRILNVLLQKTDLSVSVDGEIINAKFLIEDYYDHLNHHMMQILDGKE